MAIIFHIAKKSAWDVSVQGTDVAAAGLRSYQPEMFATDGFIHCSTRDQVIKVANLRFRGAADLLLLCIDPEKVNAEIIYENLEGGQELFPHIYGELNHDAVVQVAEFIPGADGYFVLPAAL